MSPLTLIQEAVKKAVPEIKRYFSLKGRDSVTGVIIPIWLHHFVIGGMSIAGIGVIIECIKNV